MLKSANVTLVGKEKRGATCVTVIVKSDIAVLTAAVEVASRPSDRLEN